MQYSRPENMKHDTAFIKRFKANGDLAIVEEVEIRRKPISSVASELNLTTNEVRDRIIEGRVMRRMSLKESALSLFFNVERPADPLVEQSVKRRAGEILQDEDLRDSHRFPYAGLLWGTYPRPTAKEMQYLAFRQWGDIEEMLKQEIAGYPDDEATRLEVQSTSAREAMFDAINEQRARGIRQDQELARLIWRAQQDFIPPITMAEIARRTGIYYNAVKRYTALGKEMSQVKETVSA